MTKTKIVVRIAGRDYPMASGNDEAYVRRIARYVDRKIGEMSLSTRLPALECATLAAMTIADELASSRAECERLRRTLEQERAARLEEHQP